jgi:DNA-binding winged helix-turn-helix (wHTH) protein/TolB-like protein/lipoprotein NlpI
MSRQTRHLYEFGPFRLDPEKPCLWRDGEPVPLTPKAVETLLVLIQQNGKLVEREDLMSAIWPDTFVEDGNLNFNVSMLRKALGTDETGEQYIQTVPRHGYRFSAAVREVTEEVPALIVEKHTRARVVIEERELPAELEVQSAQLLPAVQTRRKKWIYAAAGLASLALVLAVAWVFFHRQPTPLPQIRAIAVLPLKPLRNEETDKTLAFGLTDTLVTRLGGLQSIVVRPIVAVSNYAESNQDPVEIGRKLQVDAVLAGTLQRKDNRLRINARLLRVSDGALIWSGSFDENESDIFKLEDELSLQVTESLVSRLTQKEKELIARQYTQNTAASHAYWRGRFLIEKRTPEKAIPEFQQAISLDSNYALAYAGLADAYSSYANLSNGADKELYEKAESAARQALQIDPNLSEAHLALARIKYVYGWDWGAAEELFKRAIELNPNSADAHSHYALLLTTLGRHSEALTQIRKAREIDPRSAYSTPRYFRVLEQSGELDEAMQFAKEALELNKDDQIARRAMASIYLLKGEYAKLIELGNQQFPDLQETNFAWASMLANAFHKAVLEEKAAAMLKRLEKLAEKDSKALFFLAMNYSELGRKDEAISALEQCFEIREERMNWIKDEPRFAAIKDDPRFLSILRKMNLPT